MDSVRTAERVKKLKIEPIDDSLVRFRASLDDVSHDDAGDEVIHSLSIEGTISLPDLVIRSIEPHAHHHPYQECAQSLDPVRKLVGLRIGPGFRAKILDTMGGTKGCTHFLTLALDLAAAHTLSIFLRMRAKVRFDSRNNSDGAWIGTGLAIEPRLENACIALTSDSPVIRTAKKRVG
jgi:hypothetical protein